MKEVKFSGKRPSITAHPAAVDKFVESAGTGTPEPIKRLTVDMPASLHRRIKIQCAQQNLYLVQVIREFLEKRFPEQRDEQEPT